jgi:hypothetical protein
MSNPSVPDQDGEPTTPETANSEAATDVTEVPADPETEVLVTPDVEPQENPPEPSITAGERRFTAPSGMDAGATQIIGRAAEPATEIFNVAGDATQPALFPDADADADAAMNMATPQAIPPWMAAPKLPAKRRSWGWVLALILVIAALVAVAVLGTVLLTRHSDPAASQEDRVCETVQGFDTAIQKGDLAALRSITCGETADSYLKYDDRQWTDTHARVATAKQYPAVAGVDQVVVNGEHAEVNVTIFMAFDPATRSTRSFDLEFRDKQWKICQAPGS